MILNKFIIKLTHNAGDLLICKQKISRICEKGEIS